MTAFVKFVIVCALGAFLQEAWLNGEGLLEAFDVTITNLPKSILAGKTAEGGLNMIRYLKSYLAVTIENETRGKAKDRSEWVN